MNKSINWAINRTQLVAETKEYFVPMTRIYVLDTVCAQCFGFPSFAKTLSDYKLHGASDNSVFCPLPSRCSPAFVLPSIRIRRIRNELHNFFWGAVSSWISCGLATSTDRFCSWCLVNLSQPHRNFQCLQKTHFNFLLLFFRALDSTLFSIIFLFRQIYNEFFEEDPFEIHSSILQCSPFIFNDSVENFADFHCKRRRSKFLTHDEESIHTECIGNALIRW